MRAPSIDTTDVNQYLSKLGKSLRFVVKNQIKSWYQQFRFEFDFVCLHHPLLVPRSCDLKFFQALRQGFPEHFVRLGLFHTWLVLKASVAPDVYGRNLEAFESIETREGNGERLIRDHGWPLSSTVSRGDSVLPSPPKA